MARKSGDTPNRAGRARPATRTPAPRPSSDVADAGGLQAWHLLTLATMLAVTAGVLVTTGTSLANTAFAAVAIATAALAASGLYRTLMPLVAPEAVERIDMVGGRTRAALEREKMLVLRSIKEVEFDRAMRKISEADYLEVVTRLRLRATGLLRQLDGGGLGYREVIERDLAARIGAAAAVPAAPGPAELACQACGEALPAAARFCLACGAQVGEGS